MTFFYQNANSFLRRLTLYVMYKIIRKFQYSKPEQYDRSLNLQIFEDSHLKLTEFLRGPIILSIQQSWRLWRDLTFQLPDRGLKFVMK